MPRASSSDDLFQHPLCEVFDGLDWYGAKLPKSVTVSQFLAQAEKEGFDVNLEQEMIKASGWLMVHPNERKTRLGPFLMGWFRRAKNPPAWQRDARPAPIHGLGPQEIDMFRDLGRWDEANQRPIPIEEMGGKNV